MSKSDYGYYEIIQCRDTGEYVSQVRFNEDGTLGLLFTEFRGYAMYFWEDSSHNQKLKHRILSEFEYGQFELVECKTILNQLKLR